ncbi:MAG: hypothetical protein WKF43_04740 [Acidimicrobiales bacterium]
MTPPARAHQGDDLRLAERLIVAPAGGVFRSLPPETSTHHGDIVAIGQRVGVIAGPGTEVAVESFCTGYLMGMLVEPGERVRAGQPIAWLRIGAAA